MRVSGPVLKTRSNSSAARRVPPQVSGTESRSSIPSRSTRADAAAIREAVAVCVADDRQEHQLAAEAPDRTRDAPGTPGMSTPPMAERTPGFSWTTSTRATSVVSVERPIALANVDGLEACAVLQALRDRLDPVGRQRLPDGNAGEVEHFLVGEKRVAMDANLSDDLILRIAWV